MTKRELIQLILRNAEDLDSEAKAQVLYRDEDNCVTFKSGVPIKHVGFDGEVCVEGRLVEQNKIPA